MLFEGFALLVIKGENLFKRVAIDRDKVKWSI